MRLLVAAVAACLFAAAPEVTIRRGSDAFRLEGWKAGAPPAGGWASLFAVYAGSAQDTPVMGAYAVENGVLVFRPRFRLSPQMRVRAVFRPREGARIEKVFEPAEPHAGPAARVDRVYPTAENIPANQLKFYLHFSAPMSRGGVWQHIRLLDDTGAALELPFLEIEQELWDASNTRLTLLFDPGRIKRGVLPREESGPALMAGRTYTLVIGREWLDARGVPMAAEFRKTFRAAPEDRTPPEPATWRVMAPRVPSDALVVRFPEPMDSALLHRLLEVHGPGGPVRGSVAVAAQETGWRFTPAQPWAPGRYKVRVDPALEDLAGNRIGRPFDVDLGEKRPRPAPPDAIVLPFHVEIQP